MKSANSYTLVYVHVWSNPMDNVHNVIEKLNTNPKVKIIASDTFMKLIKENVPAVNTVS